LTQREYYKNLVSDGGSGVIVPNSGNADQEASHMNGWLDAVNNQFRNSDIAM